MAKIGIDFGTTNSLMVAYDKDENKFKYFSFSHDGADRPAPISSTVWYHNGNEKTIGQKAREKINTIILPKI